MKKILNCSFLLLAVTAGIADVSAQAYRPSEEEMLDRYRQSARKDSITKDKVLNEKIIPYWSSEGRYFCYERQLANQHHTYRLIDASTGENKAAFVHEKLAMALQQNLKETYAAEDLPLTDLVYIEKEKAVTFHINGRSEKYSYSDKSGLKVLSQKQNVAEENTFPSSPRLRPTQRMQETVSPDKKMSASVQGGNVFIRNIATGKLSQYTYDGSEILPYGFLSWSPDSKHLVGFHIHPVTDENVYYVLSAEPYTTRGVLKSHAYKQPGDPFTSFEMHLFDVAKKNRQKVKTDVIDYPFAPEIHWQSDASSFVYERLDRGHQRFRIVSVDVRTGDTVNVIDERTKTFIYQNRIYTHYLPATREIIRSSEQDGWQHLYLVNQSTGKEKLITKGDWVVRSVDSVDAMKREIWFSASGMNAGEDPYFIHYYKIGFDGSGLVSLTPEIGNHEITFSPDRQSFIDCYSQVNIAPKIVLKKSNDGQMISLLEEADISALLATGVSLPEPFVAKGRDGKTDIYGIVLKPSHFDKNKQYPVLENIYAGPHDSFVPKSFLGYSEMQSIAELGFIVVYIDGMGTANRSKAFHDVCWQNIADAGFPDRILWIKALAKKYSFVDTSRVGIYGTSAGGQDALGALLFHPEFYKAAVAACGCHDNRIDKQWWNEQWMGYPVGPHYEAQSNVTNAYKLKGRLMLVVGDADTNVPPESTYRVADALIKAGKAFDFLPVPGENHTDGGPYGRMRTKDFFVRELMGAPIPDRNNNDAFTLPRTGRRPSKVI